MDDKYKGEKWPFIFALPFVGAIIDREVDGEKQLLVQTRHNPKRDMRYAGTIEFPAGILDNRFESVFDALEREIMEETGLKLKRIKAGHQDESFSTNRGGRAFGFSPFYCVQQAEGDYPWIGFVFICEAEDGEPVARAGETKNPRWVSYDEMKRLVEEQPDEIFGLQLPAWKYYFSKREA